MPAPGEKRVTNTKLLGSPKVLTNVGGLQAWRVVEEDEENLVTATGHPGRPGAPAKVIGSRAKKPARSVVCLCIVAAMVFVSLAASEATRPAKVIAYALAGQVAGDLSEATRPAKVTAHALAGQVAGDVSEAMRPAEVTAHPHAGQVAGDASEATRSAEGSGSEPVLTENQQEYFPATESRKLLSALQRTKALGKRTVILAGMSSEMLDVTRNFVCSLLSTPNQLQSAGLLLVTLEAGGRLCAHLAETVEFGSVVQCVELVPTTPPLPAALSKDVRFKSDRYGFFAHHKLALQSITMDLMLQLGGFQRIIFSDVDIVVRGDVFGFLERYAPLVPGNNMLAYQKSGSCNSAGMNSGFFVLNVGTVGSRLLQLSIAKVKMAAHGCVNTNQHCVNEAVNELRPEKVPLPCFFFPNGAAYFGRHDAATKGFGVRNVRETLAVDASCRRSECEAKSLCSRSGSWCGGMEYDPLVIHFNFMNTLSTKLQCLQVSGNWFLDEAGHCTAPRPVNGWSVDVRWRPDQGEFKLKVMSCAAGR